MLYHCHYFSIKASIRLFILFYCRHHLISDQPILGVIPLSTPLLVSSPPSPALSFIGVSFHSSILTGYPTDLFLSTLPFISCSASLLECTLCLTCPILNTLLGTSTLSAKITLFFSVLVFDPYNALY